MEFMGIRPKLESPDVYTWNDGVFFSVREDTPDKVVEAMERYLEDKYKSDWNWLMGVVRRVVEHCLEDDGLFLSDQYSSILDTVSLANIEDSYNVVLDFIEYYNRLKCPHCGHVHQEGEATYLRAGFNGVKKGDPDDLDMFECVKCDKRFNKK